MEEHTKKQGKRQEDFCFVLLNECSDRERFRLVRTEFQFFEKLKHGAEIICNAPGCTVRHLRHCQKADCEILNDLRRSVRKRREHKVRIERGRTLTGRGSLLFVDDLEEMAVREVF